MNTVTIVDIETTGLSADKGAMIIEIGAIKLKNGEEIDRFSEFINPKQNISSKITDLTGITNEMVKGKDTYEIVLKRFFDFIGNDLIVAHNAKFDWNRFLVPFFSKIGKIPKNNVVDTINLSKKYYLGSNKHNLKDCCTRAGINMGNHHRAIDDAISTSKLYLYLLNNLSEAELEKCGINIDLQENCSESNCINKDKPKKENHIIIRSVKYWEKQTSKTKSIKRLYVNIYSNKIYGSVYLDLVNKNWYNKDFQETIDFQDVQLACLKFLDLKTDMELFNYRN